VSARAWYPLLRALRAAGWTHIVFGYGDTRQHVWRRNEHALNQQQITSDELLSLNIAGVDMSAAGLNPDQALLILTLVGAFDPAPEPQWRHSQAVDMAAKEALLTRAANDPELADDTFIVLAHAIEGRS
jgi:hypothetical protein